MNPGRPWSEFAIQDLRQLLKRKVSIAHVAAFLGRTETEILEQAKKHRLDPLPRVFGERKRKALS